MLFFDGEMVSLYCRSVYELGYIVVVIVGKYNLLYFLKIIFK